MPLDPQTRKFLALLSASGNSSARRPSPEERRRAFSNLMQSLEGAPGPAGDSADVYVPASAGPLKIRIVTPPAARNSVSAGVLYFHGGGWVAGSIDTHEKICARLAQASNCRIAIVEYRLAPEHKFPAALEDGIAALEWLSANASRFAIDSSRFGVAGDSVGANIAAGVARWASATGEHKLALQALLCPIMDAVGDTESRRTFAQGYFLDQATLQDDLLHYCPPGLDYRDPRLSPVRAEDFSGLPAAHIHTAEFDPARDEALSYADKLAAAGVPVEYTCHSGMIHLFIPCPDNILRNVGLAIGRALNEHNLELGRAGQ